MNKLFTVAAAAAILTGCGTVPPQKLDAGTGALLRDRTIARTSHPMPDFSAITPGKATLGILGAAAMVSEGQKIVAANKIADPADSIASELMATLASRHGARTAAAPVSVASNDSSEIAAASKGSGRYALDVQTTLWNLAYFPTDWSHYRLIYSANARLIDTETKAVLAQGSCKHMADSKTAAPTYEEMLAGGADRLKKELALAVGTCVASLKGSMLAL